MALSASGLAELNAALDALLADSIAKPSQMLTSAERMRRTSYLQHKADFDALTVSDVPYQDIERITRKMSFELE